MSSALPTNLALVGEDLARATFRDARRSARRRRSLTACAVLALLALSAATAVGRGWLFDSTPALRAAPGLTSGGPDSSPAPRDALSAAREMARSEARHRAAYPDALHPAPIGTVDPFASRILLTGLGASGRVLSSIPTTSGGVCVALTGFAVQCAPTFASGQQIIWFMATEASATVIWGIVRHEVASVEAIAADGRATFAQLANDAFYVELQGSSAVRLVARLRDGSSDAVALAPCPPTTPTCAP